MNFPQFWARGRSGDFFCWRWSSHSHAEAQSFADQAAQQLAERFQAGEYPEKFQGDYYYANRPAREQVLRELKNDSGEVMAVVTRNSYGCHVLNTARVVFVDIDLPEPKTPGFFQRLFGKPATAPTETPASAIARVELWTRQHPDWGWRIYQTRAGLRLLATHDVMPPGTPAMDAIFAALGADPLYQKLCKTQKCFRARLTPKPWRCGIHTKPARWPWLDARAETRFQRWDSQYHTYAGSWATCDFIRHVGNPTIHPEVQVIIQFHDTASRVDAKLHLA